jgi:hypothetical protein
MFVRNSAMIAAFAACASATMPLASAGAAPPLPGAHCESCVHACVSPRRMRAAARNASERDARGAPLSEQVCRCGCAVATASTASPATGR